MVKQKNIKSKITLKTSKNYPYGGFDLFSGHTSIVLRNVHISIHLLGDFGIFTFG